MRRFSVRTLARAVGVAAGTGCLVAAGLASPIAANAAHGDNNAGDVWVDNVGQPAGPGHEMDPHLACANINLWGNGLADGSGSYTIDGWPPSGSQEQDYASTWTYNTSTGGDQVTDVIDVQKLIQTAVANGDAPINKQGFHFKLQFVQDPQKHKTFWVECKKPTPPPPPQKTGYLEVCKHASGSGLAGDVFDFSVEGKTYGVPVGACTPAIQVPAGNVTVTELSRAGSALVSVSTIPANRLLSDSLSNRTAVVKVVAGDVSTQTIVTFTNKAVSGNGYLKVCKVAGSGITVGTDFTFTVGTTTVTVPAGPAPGGYCVVVGKYAFGPKTITEQTPSGDHVSAIAVAPSNRLVSDSLSGGQATVDIGSGVTEATFTNTAG